MSTGALAVVLGQTPNKFDGLQTIGKIFFILDLVLFGLFNVAMALRAYWFPRRFLASLHHPVEGLFFGSYWVSVSLLLNCMQAYGVPSTGPWLIKAINVLFWIYCAIVLVVAAVLSGTYVCAHHSFAATYFEDRTVQVEGKIVAFYFRNPHSFVHVEAPDGKKQMQRWAVEWGGAAALGSTGVTSETLKYGDIVTIIGNPGRNPEEHRIRMVSLRRKSDNFGWGQRPGEVVD